MDKKLWSPTSAFLNSQLVVDQFLQRSHMGTRLSPFQSSFTPSRSPWTHPLQMEDGSLDYFPRRFPPLTEVTGTGYCVDDPLNRQRTSRADELGVVNLDEGAKKDKAENDSLHFDVDAEQLNQHWPELKSAAKVQPNVRSDSTDKEVAMGCKKKETTYPLWNTREIVGASPSHPVELDENQNIKHSELIGLLKTPVATSHRTSHRRTHSNSHKTYAAAVQQETGKSEDVAGLKLLRKLKEKKAIPTKKDQDVNAEIIGKAIAESLIPDMDKDFHEMLSIVGPQKSLPECTTVPQEKVGVEDKGFFGTESQYNRLWQQEWPLKMDPEGLALAEEVALRGLDDETALAIATDLWGHPKSRMAYTRNFSDS